MKRLLGACALVIGLVTAWSRGTAAGSEAVRLWLLPFDNSAQDESLSHLVGALPELLTVFLGNMPPYEVVERERLDRILAEHSLSADGLALPSRRDRIGRLLGATIMVSGSFAREGKALVITALATDVASGQVQGSARVVASEDRLAEALRELSKELTGKLRAPSLPPSRTEVDPDPLHNLHFLRGLSYFYAGKHHQALAEFIQSGQDGARSDLPALWRANCYLARGQYGHAYLELVRLKRGGAGQVREAELEAKLQLCVAHLHPRQIETYDRLASIGGGR